MSQWKIEVVEREGFWGLYYEAVIRERGDEYDRLWFIQGRARGKTPQKAEANARKRIEEIKAERKRKAEVEYTVEFDD